MAHPVPGPVPVLDGHDVAYAPATGLDPPPRLRPACAAAGDCSQPPLGLAQTLSLGCSWTLAALRWPGAFLATSCRTAMAAFTGSPGSCRGSCSQAVVAYSGMGRAQGNPPVCMLSSAVRAVEAAAALVPGLPPVHLLPAVRLAQHVPHLPGTTRATSRRQPSHKVRQFSKVTSAQLGLQCAALQLTCSWPFLSLVCLRLQLQSPGTCQHEA